MAEMHHMSNLKPPATSHHLIANLDILQSLLKEKREEKAYDIPPFVATNGP